MFTPRLNRVGFEFWDLSRNHKGHVSTEKCRQLLDLSSGTPWIWNLSFCPLWPVFLLRVHFYMCSTTPHTLTCLPLPYLLFHFAYFPLFVSLLFSLLYLLLRCVPPSSLCVWRMATLRSLRPQSMITPQLWSSCWERGLTRRPRTR